MAPEDARSPSQPCSLVESDVVRAALWRVLLVEDGQRYEENALVRMHVSTVKLVGHESFPNVRCGAARAETDA